jgi:hypothetical protein
MTTTPIFVIISIVALIFILFMAIRRWRDSVTDVAELPAKTQVIDLAAFGNLIDPAEEEYLREKLSPPEFRSVQKSRLRAAIAYLNALSANAVLLVQLGETARHDANPQVAEAGLQLINNALRVRLYVISARARIYVALVVPGLRVSPSRVSHSYEQLTFAVSRLGYLQKNSAGQPTAASL